MSKSCAADGSDLDARILKQVEFYFGDTNLPRDKFLNEEMKKNSGWVPISTIASFSRMKALTEDLEIIAKALSQSKEMLEVCGETKSVRRRTAVPEIYDLPEKSVLCRGFPSDCTLDAIMEFAEKIGPVLAVRMQKDRKTNTFNGVATVVFAAKEDAARALEPGFSCTYEKGDAPATVSFEKSPSREKRKAEPEFVFGRLAKLSCVPADIKEVDIRLKLKETFPTIKFVKRLEKEDATVYLLFSEAAAEDCCDKLSSEPIQFSENLQLKPELVKDEPEQKRIVALIEKDKPNASSKRRRQR